AHPAGHAPGLAARQPGGAVGARMGAAGAAAGASRRLLLARAAGGETLLLEGRGQQQRGGGLRPRPAPQAGRRPDPQRARGGLLRAGAMSAPAQPPGPSLRRRLLGYLLLAIVLTASTQTVVAYQRALNEAGAIFDYHMRQMALSLAAFPQDEGEGEVEPAGP